MAARNDGRPLRVAPTKTCPLIPCLISYILSPCPFFTSTSNTRTPCPCRKPLVSMGFYPIKLLLILLGLFGEYLNRKMPYTQGSFRDISNTRTPCPCRKPLVSMGFYPIKLLLILLGLFGEYLNRKMPYTQGSFRDTSNTRTPCTHRSRLRARASLRIPGMSRSLPCHRPV